jgi:hypothetical protein
MYQWQDRESLRKIIKAAAGSPVTQLQPKTEEQRSVVIMTRTTPGEVDV